MQFTGCQTRVMRYARRRKFSKEWSYCILPILCLDCRHFACANINLESKTLKYRTLPRQMTWRLIKIQWRIELFWQLAVSKFKLIDLKHQRSKSSIQFLSLVLIMPASYRRFCCPCLSATSVNRKLLPRRCETILVIRAAERICGALGSFFFGGPMTSFLSNSITTK